MLTVEEAIRHLSRDPGMASALRDAYLTDDVHECGERFSQSAEFAATLRLVGWKARRNVVLDLGAGRGIASYAFARSGAARVIAVEPDPSDLVGSGALQRLCAGLPVEVVSSSAEALDIPSGSVDLVYARQVLHHLRDLAQGIREIARILAPGGLLLAAREHVAETPRDLRAFLASHPVHRLAGGENAWPLRVYRQAITGAGLLLCAEFSPLESVINSAPGITDDADLAHYPRMIMERRFGRIGRWATLVPGVESALWLRWRRPPPGSLHSFLALRS